MKIPSVRQIIGGSPVGARFGVGGELELAAMQAAQCALVPHYRQHIRAVLLAARGDAHFTVNVRE